MTDIQGRLLVKAAKAKASLVQLVRYEMDGPEDQVAASIVQAFKALKTVQARRTVYDLLH